MHINVRSVLWFSWLQFEPKQKERRTINNDGKMWLREIQRLTEYKQQQKTPQWQQWENTQGTRVEYDAQFELINGNYLRIVISVSSFLYGLARRRHRRRHRGWCVLSKFYLELIYILSDDTVEFINQWNN